MIEKNETGLYEAEIDEQRYEFQKWGAEESSRILLRIAKILAEPLGVAVGTAVSGSKGDMQKLMDLDFKPEIVTQVVRSLMTNMDEDTCMDLIKKFSSGKLVLCDGVAVNFNTHYQDRHVHMFKVVTAGLEVQYGNFFGALLGIITTMGPKAKPKGIKNHLRETSTG